MLAKDTKKKRMRISYRNIRKIIAGVEKLEQRKC